MQGKPLRLNLKLNLHSTTSSIVEEETKQEWSEPKLRTSQSFSNDVSTAIKSFKKLAKSKLLGDNKKKSTEVMFLDNVKKVSEEIEEELMLCDKNIDSGDCIDFNDYNFNFDQMTLNDGRRCDPLRSPKFCMQIPEPNSAIAKPTALSPRSPCSPRSPIGSPISPRIRQRKPTRRDSRRKSEKLFAFSSRNIVSNLNRKSCSMTSNEISLVKLEDNIYFRPDQTRNCTALQSPRSAFSPRNTQRVCLNYQDINLSAAGANQNVMDQE